MESVAQWKAGNINATAPKGSGLQSVAQWSVGRPAAPAVAPLPPPKPTLVQQGVSAVKDYAAASAATVPAFGEKVIQAVTHPIKTLVDLGNFVSKPAKDAIEKGGSALYDLATEKGTANKVADTATLLSNVAGAAFSPISGAFSVAERIPGAKQVADVLNIPFAALGTAGSWTSGKVVDYLPIPEQSKQIIKVPLQELGSLAAQVAFGGKVMERIGEFSKSGQTITPEIAQQIVDQAKTEIPAPPEPMSVSEWTAKGKPTPEELHTEYAKSQGYEPYVPQESLPVIETGKVKPELPVIQAEPAAPTKIGDLTLEPIKQVQAELATSLDTITKAAESGDTKAATTHIQELQTKLSDLATKIEEPPKVEDTGSKTSGVAKRVEVGAIEKGLIDSGYQDLATYEGTTAMKAAEGLAKLRESGMDNYRAVLRGEAPLPEGVKSGALIVDAANYLKENPKGPHVAEMVRELATSKHTSALSEAGSGLQSARGINDTFIGKLNQVRKAREARAGTTALTRSRAVPRRAIAEMNKTNLAPAELGKIEKFIDSIVC